MRGKCARAPVSLNVRRLTVGAGSQGGQSKMDIIIGGQTIQIDDLDPSIDDAFVRLHAAYLGREALKWEAFEDASRSFFDKNPEPNTGVHDRYFSNFTVIWRSFLNARNFDSAEEIWRRALSTALKWESKNTGKRLHKGTPYYFWGMTALEKGDLDKGYALMHQAVTEDKLTHGSAYPSSPAFAFASLNYSEPAQAFREWLYYQMRYIDARQNVYSARYSRPFILDTFKNKFLLSPPSVDLGFLFAYSVARLMQLSRVPSHALANEFAGQLESNLLFDVALVIDGTIKAKNAGDWRFIRHAEFLLGSYGEPLSQQELADVNQAFSNDFDGTLKAFLDGVHTISGSKAPTQAQRDVCLTYGMRNRGAHDVTSAPTVWTRFAEIEQALFNVLYLAVDILY